MRLVVLGILAAALVAAPAALPCSCAPPDPLEMLETFPAAFVGTATARAVDGQRTRWTFRIDQAVRGDLAAEIEVESTMGDADCGLSPSLVGQRVGLFLRGSPGGWTSGSCYLVDPEALLAATSGLPAPTGDGPAAYLVGGAFGAARVIALDAQARTLGYGTGQGEVVGLAVCPGGRRVAELVTRHPAPPLVAVPDLATLGVIAEHALPVVSDAWPLEIGCRAEDGSDLLAFVRSETGLDALLRIVDGRASAIWEGEATEAWLSVDEVLLCRGTDGRSLVTLDPASAEERELGLVPAYTASLAPSPDGRWIAAVAYSVPDGTDETPSRVVLVDRAGPVARVTTSPLETWNVFGHPVWLDATRFAYVNGGGDRASGRILDTSLRELARLPDVAARGAIAHRGRVLALTFDGRVVEVVGDSPGSDTTLPSSGAFALVAVDDPPVVETPAAAPRPAEPARAEPLASPPPVGERDGRPMWHVGLLAIGCAALVAGGALLWRRRVSGTR